MYDTVSFIFCKTSYNNSGCITQKHKILFFHD